MPNFLHATWRAKKWAYLKIGIGICLFLGRYMPNFLPEGSPSGLRIKHPRGGISEANHRKLGIYDLSLYSLGVPY